MGRDHEAALVDFYGCAQVMAIRKFGVMDRARALASLEEILEHWHRHGFGLWAVSERGNDAFIGECGLRCLEDGTDVELSYGFLPGYWGRGYATEAARMVILHSFDVLNLSCIVALSRADNTASHRVLEKCGMSLVERQLRPGGGLVKYRIDAPC